MLSSVSKSRQVVRQVISSGPIASFGKRSDSFGSGPVTHLNRSFAAPPHGAHSSQPGGSADYDSFKLKSSSGRLSSKTLIRYNETHEELLGRKDNFNQWSVHIGDKAALKSKLQAIQSDGSDNLMIIADFDQTISSFYVPEEMRVLREERRAQLETDDSKVDPANKPDGPLLAEATIKVMLECDKVTQEDIDETRSLFKKYRPIEIDPALSLAEKQKHMSDWWTENLKLFSSLKLTDYDFRKMVAKSRMACRHGIVELLEQVRVNDLPFIVVSGGVKEVIDVIFYEIIREQLMKSHLPYDLKEYEHFRDLYNLRVLSNTFHFDNVYNHETKRKERTAVDYDDRLLHSMNKYEFVNQVSKDLMTPLIRKNVIVMGDQIHDLKVVEPSNHENILSIGYLNDVNNEEAQMKNFLENFDIVICRDGPLLPLNIILDTLTVDPATAHQGSQEQGEKIKKYAEEFPQLEEIADLLLPTGTDPTKKE